MHISKKLMNIVLTVILLFCNTALGMESQTDNEIDDECLESSTNQLSVPYVLIDENEFDVKTPDEFIYNIITSCDDIDQTYEALYKCLYVAGFMQYNVESDEKVTLDALLEFNDSIGLEAWSRGHGHRVILNEHMEEVCYEQETIYFQGGVSLSFYIKTDELLDLDYCFDNNKEYYNSYIEKIELCLDEVHGGFSVVLVDYNS